MPRVCLRYCLGMNKAACAGFLAPCSNLPDPAFTVEDPEGTGDPVLFCADCGRAGEEFFRRVFADRRLVDELNFAVEAAHASTSPGGIS